jgi:hypothetical protein
MPEPKLHIRLLRIQGFSLIKLFIIAIFSFLLDDCKKEENLPVITTLEVSGITAHEAISGGVIISDGGDAIIAKGVCWSTKPYPAIADYKTDQGESALSFTSIMTDLSAVTKYYVRAYATNSNGTSYGKNLSFSTAGAVPIVTTQFADHITGTNATVYGIVNPNYLTTDIIFEYGLTTEYGDSVVARQSPLSGNTYFIVNANLSGLTKNTDYHFRVKAGNSLGISIGKDMVFTTNDILTNPF